ncbi:oligosaccharide flippase family protein [bacterium]|nr:oligosaccharide flippase family protein [bacterium]
MISRIVFLVAGYALYLAMGRMLSTEQFGLYGVVFAVLSIVNMVFVVGATQTVSHFVAGKPGQEGGVWRLAALTQLAFAAPVGVAFAFAAPLVAAFFRDAAMTLFFRWVGIIAVLYALLAVNLGYLNGRARFGKQAAIDIAFQVVRVGTVIYLVAIGYGVHGALAGTMLAALFVFLASMLVIDLRGVTARVDLGARRLASYGVTVMTVALFLHVLMTNDLLLLKRLSHEANASLLAGYYTAAQSIARIPFFLMTAMALVIFPAVAKLRGTTPEAARLMAARSSTAMTMTLAAVAGMVLAAWPVLGEIVTGLYPDTFAPAVPSTKILLVTMAMLALVNVGTSIASGVGRPGVSAGILLTALAVQTGCATLLIPRGGVEGAAWSTAAGCVAALGAIAYFLVRHLDARIPGRALVAIGAGGVSAYGVSWTVAALSPPGFVTAALAAGLGFAAHVAILALGGLSMPVVERDEPRRILLVPSPRHTNTHDAGNLLVASLARHIAPGTLAVVLPRGHRGYGLTDNVLRPYRIYPAATLGPLGGHANMARLFAFLFANRGRFTAIHFLFEPGAVMRAGLRLLRIATPRMPFIQTLMHHPSPPSHRRVGLFADAVTAASEEDVQLVKLLRGDADVHLVRPAVDASIVKADRAELCRRLALSPAAFHIMYVGDLWRDGAMPHLINIAPTVLGRSERIHFHLFVVSRAAGTNDRAERYYARHLSAFCDRASLHLGQNAFDELLALQSALLLPCESPDGETDTALTALAAMGRGIPVFMLDRSPQNEVVPPALRDRLIAHDDGGLARRVLEFFEAPASIPPQDLIRHVHMSYDPRTAARKMERIYESLARRGEA